jgi:hypothetical protein
VARKTPGVARVDWVTFGPGPAAEAGALMVLHGLLDLGAGVTAEPHLPTTVRVTSRAALKRDRALREALRETASP